MYCTNYGSTEAARIKLERKYYWILGAVFIYKLTIAHLVITFPKLYATQMLVTLYKTLATCTCLDPDEPISGPPIVFLKLILILSHKPCLGVHVIYSFRFPHQTLYIFLFCPIHTTYNKHFNILDLMSLIIFSEEYETWNLSWCNFFYSTINFITFLRVVFPQHITKALY
jgi:hypothetical protein